MKTKTKRSLGKNNKKRLSRTRNKKILNINKMKTNRSFKIKGGVEGEAKFNPNNWFKTKMGGFPFYYQMIRHDDNSETFSKIVIKNEKEREESGSGRATMFELFNDDDNYKVTKTDDRSWKSYFFGINKNAVADEFFKNKKVIDESDAALIISHIDVNRLTLEKPFLPRPPGF
jgi:hypothetical protein